jgi:hypothetical protein
MLQLFAGTALNLESMMMAERLQKLLDLSAVVDLKVAFRKMVVLGLDFRPVPDMGRDNVRVRF